jgi:hypothetical protein
MRLLRVSEPMELNLPEMPLTGFYSGRFSSTRMACAERPAEPARKRPNETATERRLNEFMGEK